MQVSFLGKIFHKKTEDIDLSNNFNPNEMGGQQVDTGLPPLDQGSGFDTTHQTSFDPLSQQATDPMSSTNKWNQQQSFDHMNTMSQQSPSSPPPEQEQQHQFKSPEMQRFHQQSQGQQMAQSYIQQQEEPQQRKQQASTQDHALEVISLKLDAIKHQLDSFNERLKRIEGRW
jgi:hypothetical protein